MSRPQVSPRDHLSSEPGQSGKETERKTRMLDGLREPISWFALALSATSLIALVYGITRLVGELLLAVTGLVGSL
ncbi:hypothetical protein ABYF34_03965 [Buchananella felis]|uniref:hypothetical protein n=1 Tax=Buchananella felis TaxID=3231492 RepID=UPI003529A173